MGVNDNKNVALFCTTFRFSQIEFNKPPFCLMYYLKKVYSTDSDIYFDEVLYPLYYNEKNEFNFDSWQGVKLNKINGKNDTVKEVKKKYIKTVSEKAKNLDLLVLFHGNNLGLKIAKRYKKLNKFGKVLTVLDYTTQKNGKKTIKEKLKGFAKKVLLYRRYAKVCDAFTIQTSIEYENIKRFKWNGIDISDKLEMMPFGVDFNELDLSVDCQNKKNIMLTVGRLGSIHKNTELILDALDGIDLKDWEFHLIGPVEKEFESKIQKFYERNESLKEKVRFLGAVEDRKYISRLYAESKVFVLSSVSESFAIVLVESASFGNYILSTDVGCVRDVAKYNNGEIYKNSAELKECILKIVNGETDISDAKNCNKTIIESFDWNNVVKNSVFFSEVFRK